MTLTQAILLGVLYYFANSPWPFGGLGNYAILYRPMILGLIVGIILGNPALGVTIGATINLMYIGFISAGGSMPADMSLAGILGTALAISGGLDMNAALAVAVPLGLLGALVWVGRLTFDSVFVRLADKYTEEGKPEKIWIVNILLPQILLFLITAIPCFLAAYYGADMIANLINKLGGNFLRILSVIGGMLPAVGIGMMLMAIYKGPARVFFFLGFLVSAFLGLKTLPLALIFLALTIIYISLKYPDEPVTEEESADISGGGELKTSKLLDRKDILSAWWKWMYYFQSCYNYERMQGIGFLHAMSPVLSKLYKDDPEEMKAAMRRHGEFFNTENATGSAVIGLVVAMEEQKKLGADLSDEAFTSIKTGLMGPLAGVGDTIWQGVMIPLMIVLFLGPARDGNVGAPILYAILFYLIYYAYGYWLLRLGYNRGSEAILNLMENKAINKVIVGAGIMGSAVMGGLVSQYVNVSTAIKFPMGPEKEFSLQTDFFDALVPGLLGLLLTLGAYTLLKRGWKTQYVILLVIAIAVIGGLIGIF
ncbi:MAG: PTS system mannose/fructose/sorbose family transporter subunit IID [Anaerolineaceae bacterium]|jgi:mannose/fructose/N-acetylgalactosamine-specific phosphotransferase system component IID/mannose/fructose/N-acetylgalactosamine-specific phosphotransferase system component IIC